jgi:hypothetical protein
MENIADACLPADLLDDQIHFAKKAISLQGKTFDLKSIAMTAVSDLSKGLEYKKDKWESACEAAWVALKTSDYEWRNKNCPIDKAAVAIGNALNKFAQGVAIVILRLTGRPNMDQYRNFVNTVVRPIAAETEFASKDFAPSLANYLSRHFKENGVRAPLSPIQAEEVYNILLLLKNAVGLSDSGETVFVPIHKVVHTLCFLYTPATMLKVDPGLLNMLNMYWGRSQAISDALTWQQAPMVALLPLLPEEDKSRILTLSIELARMSANYAVKTFALKGGLRHMMATAFSPDPAGIVHELPDVLVTKFKAPKIQNFP